MLAVHGCVQASRGGVRAVCVCVFAGRLNAESLRLGRTGRASSLSSCITQAGTLVSDGSDLALYLVFC